MSRYMLIRNLLAMAAADGSFSHSELELLAHKAVEWGLTESEFESALTAATSPDAEVEVPAADEDRRELLRELLEVMGADGQLSDAEKQLFSIVAATIQIADEELNTIIDEALRDAGESL